ncbi:Signal transduction histidine kinase CheA [hydrothermal vent metagenome]|uniref:histidine kinase n=1 Tax=hydrothermal vent metagenome TaxID=652676 RepID=A0A3B1D379_9ZZZZ
MEEEEESILDEFLVECSEGLEQLDQQFVALEQNPTDESLLGSIFRAVHTIKGTCGFLGLPKLENVAHGAENILSAMRDHDMDVSSDGITVLLEAVDVIKEILEHIEAERREPDKNYDSVRKNLDDFLAASTDTEAVAPMTEAEAALMREMAGDDEVIVDDPDETQSSEETITSEATEEASGAEAVVQEAESVNEISEVPPETTTPSPPQKSPEPVSKAPAATKTKKKLSLAESSIRVDVGLLDKLINMVGELVLARNQLLQQVRQQTEASPSNASSGTVQQINLITTELQDTVMKTRMQPIKNVWDKFPRVVRDLARANGKDVDLVMEGAETELDKTLLEAIKDPMTHIIRNAADHGIELPELRRERGKSEKGTLLLKAYHEGGHINILISDDGAGINVDRVKNKAVEKGVVTQEIADKMSERESLNLIFHPGLSTAEKVTNVSGRGVGMDVVKTNIEKIGGTVSMSSRVGEGTQMRIEIPLTLAIIPALMVTSGNEPFAIPQASLLELVRVDEESRNQIEVIRGANFYRLRGVLLPLLYLNEVLVLRPPKVSEDDIHSKGTNIVVLRAGDHSFGLVVDTVNDSEEIVVKPLSRQLKDLSYLAGATILGDGRVALILDVMGVAQEGGLKGDEQNDTGRMVEADALINDEEGSATMILFSMNEEDRYAIPLSEVARLEEFDVEKIEQSAGQDVMQYRDELLPLVRLGDALGVMTSGEENDRVPVIVFSRHEKSIGVIVGRIIDIVEAEMHLHAAPSEKIGVKGSLVIDGKTTDLLDIEQLIECVVPGWLEEMVV